MDERAERTSSFGYWLRRRRKALDLTQEELAQRVSCSRFAIRKIEADERRPSRALAERLADRLAVPADERAAFLEAARAIHRIEQLAVGSKPVSTPANLPVARSDTATGFRSASNPLAPIATPALSDLGRLPFVGRGAQFGQLRGLIANLATGNGYVALIEGEPGIGKSRLIGEVIRHAESLGLPTLLSSCYEIEQGMPYQPVIELVTQALDHCASGTLGRLPPISLAEIASLVPTVAERVPDLPVLSTQLTEARQARLFHAIEQLFDTLAGSGPLIVAVDDIHWVDDASLQFLHTVARHTARRRILLILAYRGEEIVGNARVATLLESIRRDPSTRHFPLSRLTEADTRLLLAAADPAFHAPAVGLSLHRETDGHPFFLISMMQSIADQGLPGGADSRSSPTAKSLPEAVRNSVRARLAHVPREARALLDVAAVLGRRFKFDTLLAATKASAPALLDMIDTLVQRGLLREEEVGGDYDFSHDKIREAVYVDIGGARRMLLHRAVAEALEPHAGGPSDERAAHLAEHFARGQVWAKAVAYLVKAVERSQRLFATRESLGLLDRVIELIDAHPDAAAEDIRLRIREQRGTTRAQAGQIDGAVADFEHVIAAARMAGDPVRERDLMIQLGMAYRRGDLYQRATTCLSEALAASRSMHDEPHAADALYHLGTVAWSNGRNAEAILHHQEAVEICERLALTDLVAVQAFHGRGEAYFADAKPALAIECYLRSTAFAKGIGDKSYESENLMMIGWANLGSMGLGDYPHAIKHLDAGLAIAQAADLAWHIGPLRIARDHIRHCLGQFGEAWQGLNETLTQLESLNLVRYQIMACNMLGHLLLDLSLDTKATEAFDRGLGIAQQASITHWTPLLHVNRAIARMRQGALDIDRELEGALKHSLQNREGWFLPRCYEGLAELHVRRGDAKQCNHYADQLQSLGEQGNLREAIARAHRWRGEAMLASGNLEAAANALGTALEASEQLGTMRLSWDIRGALARVAREAERPGEAKRHDTAARDLSARIEASLRGSDLESGLGDLA
ncbi:MAG: AAA family ATPase [Burkholderiales bacterium]